MRLTERQMMPYSSKTKHVNSTVAVRHATKKLRKFLGSLALRPRDEELQGKKGAEGFIK